MLRVGKLLIRKVPRERGVLTRDTVVVFTPRKGQTAVLKRLRSCWTLSPCASSSIAKPFGDFGAVNHSPSRREVASLQFSRQYWTVPLSGQNTRRNPFPSSLALDCKNEFIPHSSLQLTYNRR